MSDEISAFVVYLFMLRVSEVVMDGPVQIHGIETVEYVSTIEEAHRWKSQHMHLNLDGLMIPSSSADI